MTALVPVRYRKGAHRHQRTARKQDKRRAGRGPRRAPQFLRVNAQFLARQRIQGAVLIGHQLGGDGCGFVLGEPLGLIDQGQLLLLLLRDLLDLLRLDGQLPLVEFTGALDREPLAHGHRAGTGEQPRQAGDQDRRSRERGARHAHDQTESGDQAVIRAEHGGAQRVPTNGPVASFEAGKRVARETGLADDGAEEAGVGALIDRERGVLGFRLAIIHVTIHALERGDGRQDPLRSEALGQPDEHAGPPARPWWRYGRTSRPEVLLPEPGMPVLNRGETLVELRELRLRLERGEGAVEGGTVHLVLPVVSIAGHIILRGHVSSCCASRWMFVQW